MSFVSKLNKGIEKHEHKNEKVFSPFILTKVQRKIISFNVFLVYCEIIKLFVFIILKEVDFGRLGGEIYILVT